MYDIVTITVNYKMKEKILKMLASLFKDIEKANLKIKLVVVDNASLDGIEQALAEMFPQVYCLVNSKNLGFGTANNLAMKQFEAKYYFAINPDIIFPEGERVIEKLYQFMERYPKIGLVAPKLILEDGSVQPSCLRFPAFLDQLLYRLDWQEKYLWAKKKVQYFLMSDFDHTKTSPVDWVTGAALFIRGEALRQVDYFDERYFLYFEDCDLCRKLWESGWPVYYKGDVYLYHGHERASAKIPGIKSIFKNKLTRIHLVSWLKYWLKWKKRTL
jgi:GT2 family glycosyltransferase